MSERLGEMLRRIGALTKAQLEQALRAQSIYGGRLGTNLVEMGLLGEEELAHLLNRKMGIPYVEVSALESIPVEVIGIVPHEMLQRHRVLPLAVYGKRLTLAMADPCDFRAIDEIGFATGLVVVPRVCSELRLNIALERNCGIKREIRYIPVAGGPRSRSVGAAAQWDADYGSAAGSASEPRNVCAGRVTLDALADALALVSGEGQVVSALLRYLGWKFDRAGFWQMKGGTVLGVQAVDAGSQVEGFHGYAIALDDAQQLRRVVQEGNPFLGELTEQGADGRLVEAMGGGVPAPALVLPLGVGGKVAAVLCVSDTSGRLAAGAPELQRVVAMTELSFEMLCLRKRIRSV